MGSQASAWVPNIGLRLVANLLANSLVWLNLVLQWAQGVCLSLGTIDFTEKKGICKHLLLSPTYEAVFGPLALYCQYWLEDILQGFRQKQKVYPPPANRDPIN